MRFVALIDWISRITGSFAAWLIIPLLLVVVYEVVARHLFNAPSGWGYDTCWMLFAAQFLIGGAYTLLQKSHIRIDIVYNLLSDRGKLIFDLIIYLIVFLVPAVLFTWAGIHFAAEAWAANEKLSTTNWFFPSGPPKSLIPIGFFLLTLQCIAEIIRSIKALAERRGA
jgi:TRAP-type mannitol/chloroaromatic compound transport system permease small subunit